MYDTNSAPKYPTASRRERKATSSGEWFALTALERRVLVSGGSAWGADLMGPLSPTRSASLAASAPLSSVPILDSRPAAFAKLYLDFPAAAAYQAGGHPP